MKLDDDNIHQYVNHNFQTPKAGTKVLESRTNLDNVLIQKEKGNNTFQLLTGKNNNNSKENTFISVPADSVNQKQTNSNNIINKHSSQNTKLYDSSESTMMASHISNLEKASDAKNVSNTEYFSKRLNSSSSLNTQPKLDKEKNNFSQIHKSSSISTVNRISQIVDSSEMILEAVVKNSSKEIALFSNRADIVNDNSSEANSKALAASSLFSLTNSQNESDPTKQRDINENCYSDKDFMPASSPQFNNK